ncbi:hypothetical protein FYK55_21800 [Roseiconus nitratireducens]|uniref:Transmembrane protein n=1 Tax=Roseiconus nitratireducens TaxID=2605748 RepID=A0A5M6CYG8_9BACT|nr:hypothetical protein [Roseiconus nitratireducens]KAA5540264.1 hypothetical protein FYK55_21800 [Roseiconus nitratireducens]
MHIESIYLLIGLLPLIGYLMLLGLIRLSGRSLITTGGRDIATLGLAIAGLVAVGPGELFFPKAAAGLFGAWVWLALAVFYGLIVCLVALVSRPRLVIYGRTPSQMIDPLLAAAQELDGQSTCDRERLEVTLPTLKVRLRIGGQPGLDSATVESFAPISSSEFWDKLLGHLRVQSQTTTPPTPRRGAMMLAASILLATFALYRSMGDRQQIVEQFGQWLWR